MKSIEIKTEGKSETDIDKKAAQESVIRKVNEVKDSMKHFDKELQQVRGQIILKINLNEPGYKLITAGDISVEFQNRIIAAWKK